MHAGFKRADRLSHEAIGAAIEVHRVKGAGLIESIYERCLMRELELRNIATINQRLVEVEYKGLVFEEPLRFDILAEDCHIRFRSAAINAYDIAHANLPGIYHIRFPSLNPLPPPALNQRMPAVSPLRYLAHPVGGNPPPRMV